MALEINKYQQTIKDAINHVENDGTFILKQKCEGKKMFYKLDENKNVIPSSIKEWSTFKENKLPTNYCMVAKDIIKKHKISTIFIGIYHNFYQLPNIPLVFETIIFDKNDRSIYQRRYSTWEEAEAGHKKAMEWVKNGCKDDEDK